MVVYGSGTGNTHRHSVSCHHKSMANEEDCSEIDFEGWVQLCPNVNVITERNSGSRCCSKCQCANKYSCHGRTGGDNLTSMEHTARHAPAHEHQCTRAGCSSGGNKSQTNFPRRCTSTLGHCGAKHITHQGGCNREMDDALYVNNRQHPPKILVQKPQTVIVRNESRPPIVVQQPPPNVIVKNDPPQPVYVQNCPPNVIIKNEPARAPRGPPTTIPIQQTTMHRYPGASNMVGGMGGDYDYGYGYDSCQGYSRGYPAGHVNGQNQTRCYPQYNNGNNQGQQQQIHQRRPECQNYCKCGMPH